MFIWRFLFDESGNPWTTNGQKWSQGSNYILFMAILLTKSLYYNIKVHLCNITICYNFFFFFTIFFFFFFFANFLALAKFVNKMLYNGKYGLRNFSWLHHNFYREWMYETNLYSSDCLFRDFGQICSNWHFPNFEGIHKMSLGGITYMDGIWMCTNLSFVEQI